MNWDMEAALADPLVRPFFKDHDEGYYELQIGELTEVVWITIGRFITSDQAKYAVSHYLRTPAQIAPFKEPDRLANDPADALRKAVESFTIYYRLAVSQGYEPSDKWLVEFVDD